MFSIILDMKRDDYMDIKKYEVLLNEDLSRTLNIDKILTRSELEKLRNR